MGRKQDKKLEESNIAAKPVLEELAEPGYPTRCWGKAAAGAATFFLAINIGGVVESQTPETVNPSSAVVQQAKSTSGTNTQQQNQNTTIVAPLFEHGKGSGSTGCVVITPPVFLSEEEALQVIKDELGKHGIELGKGGELKDVMVRMPVTSMYYFLEGMEFGDEGIKIKAKKEKKEKKLGELKPLNVDAMSQDKNIAIEFVSKADFVKLHQNNGMGCSVRAYNPKSVAKHLTEEAAGNGNKTLYLGIFYDPMATVNRFGETSEEIEKRMKKEEAEEKNLTEEQREKLALEKWERLLREKKGKTLSWDEREKLSERITKKQLRQQVSDFVGWLDKQGVELVKTEPVETEEK